MTMSDTGKRIDSIIKLGLGDALKSLGFKKQARNFRRIEPDGSILVINIQSSLYNETGRGVFTVNLGRYLPDMAREMEREVHDKPKEHECHARIRIGRLLPGIEADYWWQVDARSNLDALAAELKEAVILHGIAWFESPDSMA